MKMTNQQVEHVAMRVSRVSIIANVILSLIKLLAGIVASSGAMISDAAHSASDVFSTFVVIVGIKISTKEADAGHPYGHERLECVAAIVLSVLLFATGVGIGYNGVHTIIFTNLNDMAVPGALALAAAVLSIAVKEIMYWYTRFHAKQINSGALMADAWHHRSDALSSVGAFAGILGARLGYPILDPIASIVICIFVLKAAIDIFKDAVDKMVDKSCDEAMERRLCAVALSVDGVLRIDLIRTRVFGNRIYVDIEIACDGNSTLNQTHQIADEVHGKIEQTFEEVKHIMVHVNPYKRESE
jgi:cation diffusion facilitator family transporter